MRDFSLGLTTLAWMLWAGLPASILALLRSTVHVASRGTFQTGREVTALLRLSRAFLRTIRLEFSALPAGLRVCACLVSPSGSPTMLALLTLFLWHPLSFPCPRALQLLFPLPG